MPDLKWNMAVWAGSYDWQTSGEEWSSGWGGSEPQWFSSIYPRLHRFFPAAAILEIAPGFGRWTKFLLAGCNDYVGIDLSDRCIAACRDTFRNVAHAHFFENDGVSLDMAADEHFDLVFSFDSLVHAEMDVMAKYVPQILRKLTPRGIAFLHHSNLAALPPDVQNQHSRARSVSAERVAEVVDQAGGKVLLQERINWGGPHLNDCLTLFAHELPEGLVGPIHVDNERFMDEAAIIQNMHAAYSHIGVTK